MRPRCVRLDASTSKIIHGGLVYILLSHAIVHDVQNIRAVIFLGGDVVGHPVLSFERPDWHWGTDWDAEMGAKTRRRTLDMLAADKIALLGYHLPWPGLARVVREGSAFRMTAMEL